MKDSEVLKKAREYLLSGTRHICNAIGDTWQDGVPGWQRDSLRKWVHHMLGGVSTYDIWLRKHHPHIHWDTATWPQTEGRLAWLDWMIAYCEAEEAREVA